MNKKTFEFLFFLATMTGIFALGIFSATLIGKIQAGILLAVMGIISVLKRCIK